MSAHAVNQSYTTDWIANTYGQSATHVQNASRSMWVAPEGTIYTASAWDENGCNTVGYVNGKVAQCIGLHGGPTGRAITGNATDLWLGMGFNKLPSGLYSAGMVWRYNRSTGINDQQIQVSADTTERKADTITGLATWGQFWAASDHPGNRVRLYLTSGTWVRDIPVTDPGALAFDRNGNLLVAQEAEGTVLQISQTGTILHTLALPTGEAPHSLYYDPAQYLWIGDAGPDQNAKVYDTRTFAFVKSFGATGGYLNTTGGGTKGQIGSMRFARIDGIGKDTEGNTYVLSEPWGQTWDNGRTGGTDIYAYSATGTLLYNLQGLNFESIGAPDPATDATVFYSGTNIYSCAAYPCRGGKYVANTVDPFEFPADARINPNTNSRGNHFGMVADLPGGKILVAHGQNPDEFFFYHFDSAQGYIAIPDGCLCASDSVPFGTAAQAHIRHGFNLDSKGGVWAGLDKTTTISYWPLLGFDANGKPSWGPEKTWPTPSTLGVQGRILYLPESDTLILADIPAGSTDTSAIGTRVEVYRGWLSGNQSNPAVINLTSANPKSISAAGNYLFVGYVHTVPNVDAYNLTTGTLDNTFTTSDPSVYVGNDVDSVGGIHAVLRSNGEYVVTKDDYNGVSIVIYRWVP